MQITNLAIAVAPGRYRVIVDSVNFNDFQTSGTKGFSVLVLIFYDFWDTSLRKK